MSIFIISGSNLPEQTHQMMGMVKIADEMQPFNIDVSQLSANELIIYNDFFNLIGNNVSVEIINSPHLSDFNHVTPVNVEFNDVVIDYSTKNQAEKEIIDNFILSLQNV